MRRFVLCLIAALFPSLAWGQGTLLQGGTWTPGHAPMYVGQGGSQAVVQDSGPAGGGAVGVGLNEILAVARGTGTPPYVAQGTGPYGTNICDYDAPITNATGYHYLCFSPNSQGGGLIAYGAGGTATALPLNLIVNGVLTNIAGGTLPASSVFYTAPGTGAVQVTAADVFNQEIFADQYGVSPSSSDNCAGINAAITAAATNQRLSKIVWLPKGVLATGATCQIILKSFVQLSGDVQQPMQFNGQSPESLAIGTTLLVKNLSDPFIINDASGEAHQGMGTTLKNIIFMYPVCGTAPCQNPPILSSVVPVAFPATYKITGFGSTLENLIFVNSYDAIWDHSPGYTRINNIFIGAYHNDIVVDNNDLGALITNINISPWWNMPTDVQEPQNLTVWSLSNGDGITLKRAANTLGSNIFIDGKRRAFSITNTGDGRSGYGAFSNVELDTNVVGVYADSTVTTALGYQFSNLDVGGNSQSVIAISSVSNSGGLAQLHVSDSSGYSAGQIVTVAGTSAIYDGQWSVSIIGSGFVTISATYSSNATGFLSAYPQPIAAIDLQTGGTTAPYISVTNFNTRIDRTWAQGTEVVAAGTLYINNVLYQNGGGQKFLVGGGNLASLTTPNYIQCTAPIPPASAQGCAVIVYDQNSSAEGIFTANTVIGIGSKSAGTVVDLLYGNAVAFAITNVPSTGIVHVDGSTHALTASPVALPELATQATNTVVGNATSGTAVPTALAMPSSCNTSSSALNWTTNSGFGACNNAINAKTVTATAPTGTGIGYATGAGGAVTQATDRVHGVTLSTLAGQITTNNASLAAEAAATFVVTNTTVALGDTIILSIQSGSNGGNTKVFVSTVTAGTFSITVANDNASGGTAETGAIIINYAVLKSVAS